MAVKAEFAKVKLTLCSPNKKPLGILTNRTHRSCYNVKLKKKINETYELSFDIAAGGLIDHNSTELLVKLDFDYYIIKEINVSSSDSAMFSVTCESEPCELKGIVVGYSEDLIGATPQQMWETVVNNCSIPDIINERYVFVTDIYNTFRSLKMESEKSIFEYLVNIAEQFQATFTFKTDVDGIITITMMAGEYDRKKIIKSGKDLKSLNISLSTNEIFTRITPFGAIDDTTGMPINIMEVNGGKSYLENYDYYLSKGMTLNEIRSNPKCIQEAIYNNSDIVTPEDLLRVAKEELDKISVPVLNGTVDVLNIGCLEGYYTTMPILNEKIIFIDKTSKYNISSKVTEIEIDYDKPLKTKVSISNVVQYSSTFKDLVQNSQVIDKVTSTENGKPVLNASKVQGLIDGHIAQLKYSMVDSITDITDVVILFECDQLGHELYGALAIGSRGILISKEKTFEGGWKWSTAIDAKGLSTQIVNALEINGSQIKGDIISSYDNSTWINLNDGTFNFKDKIKYVDGAFSVDISNNHAFKDFTDKYEEDKKVIDSEINDIYNELENVKTSFDDAIVDGIVTEGELSVIRASLLELEKEKQDVVTRCDSIKNDSYLNGDVKILVTTSYNSYITAHTSLVSQINKMVEDRLVNDIEKAIYDSCMETYVNCLSDFSSKLDTALKNIAENNTEFQIGNLKEQLQEDIKDVNDKLDDIIDDVGDVIADGIINEAEIMIIKNSLTQLEKEKEDVDMSYTTLYNDENLKGTYKTNLQMSYNNYNTAHNNLIQEINSMILDGKATDEERISFESKTAAYSNALNVFQDCAKKAIMCIDQSYATAKIEILNDSITSKVSQTEMIEYVDNSIISATEDLQNQIDGKIQTYFQATDPSIEWTTSEFKNQHIGDIWYDNLNNVTYRWNGTSWGKLTDADAEFAKSLAYDKAQVFTETPSTPYYKGDLWVQGSGGDIMRCIVSRTSGSYDSSDWNKASKYTDDTTANNVKNDLSNNYYTKTTMDTTIQQTKESILSTASKDVDVKLEDYSTTTQMNSTIEQKANGILSTVSSTYATKTTANNLQSQINQNATDISSKVSNNNFSTLFNQNANGFNFNIGSSSMDIFINKNGITVKNGALTIKNNAGTNVFSSDSNGDITFNGYLIGKDQQVKLIGDTMKIDGRGGALRFQFDADNYLLVQENHFKFYSTNSYKHGNEYICPSIRTTDGGDLVVSGGLGQMKILNNATYPDLQARNQYDDAYARVCGSAFVQSSKSEFKENIEEADTDKILKILKSNMVKKYNYISERERLNELDLEALGRGIELEWEMVTPDEKLGLVIEELTEDAKNLLAPSQSEGIDLYSMLSILWEVTQSQQDTIEKQQKQIDLLESRLSEIEEIIKSA